MKVEFTNSSNARNQYLRVSNAHFMCFLDDLGDNEDYTEHKIKVQQLLKERFPSVEFPVVNSVMFTFKSDEDNDYFCFGLLIMK